MALRLKSLVWLLVVMLAFAAGTWTGYHTNHGDVDPQDYITTVFTPYEDGVSQYLSFLDKAHKSVYIADYAYTDQRITEKLIELKTKRHVDVHLLLDLSQTRGRSGKHEMALIDQLRAAGIEVVIGTSEKSHQIMHDKYTVIDGLYVESGSWNYTKSANDQDNTLDFIKSPKRARLFLDNWRHMHSFMQEQEADRNSGEKHRPRRSH